MVPNPMNSKEQIQFMAPNPVNSWGLGPWDSNCPNEFIGFGVRGWTFSLSSACRCKQEAEQQLSAAQLHAPHALVAWVPTISHQSNHLAKRPAGFGATDDDVPFEFVGFWVHG